MFLIRYWKLVYLLLNLMYNIWKCSYPNGHSFLYNKIQSFKIVPKDHPFFYRNSKGCIQNWILYSKLYLNSQFPKCSSFQSCTRMAIRFSNKEMQNLTTLSFFYKQLGSGLSPQSCLYFQGSSTTISARNTVIFRIQNRYLWSVILTFSL